MKKAVRYRVYGVVDETTEGIEDLLEEMRQYGSAFVVDTEVVEIDENDISSIPDAEKDFKSRYQVNKGLK